MKLGMNMLLWTTHVTEEHFSLFPEFKESGFDGVEIPIGDGEVSHYEAIGRALADNGLEATAVHSLMEDQNPVSPDPAVRRAGSARLRWAIERAKALGSDRLVGPFHSAYAVFSGEPPTEVELDRSAEVLRGAAEFASDLGMKLAIEPLNRFECYLVNTAADGAALAVRAGHPALGTLYDTHHAHIEEQDIGAAIRDNAAAISHVHVSENDRGVPGRGLVDWRTSFRAMRESGYDGWLVIEAFSRLDPAFASAIHVWRSFCHDPEEIFREGGPFLRRTWEECGPA